MTHCDQRAQIISDGLAVRFFFFFFHQGKDKGLKSVNYICYTKAEGKFQGFFHIWLHPLNLSYLLTHLSLFSASPSLLPCLAYLHFNTSTLHFHLPLSQYFPYSPLHVSPANGSAANKTGPESTLIYFMFISLFFS